MAKAGFNANAPQFSPNGQSILAMGGTKAAGRSRTMQLALYSISTRAFTLLQLRPKASAVLSNGAAWSPTSETVLCALTPTHTVEALDLILAAVDAASAAVTCQRMHMSGVCNQVSWGAAGYVALACTNVSRIVQQRAAAVYLCLAVGSPVRITVLHKVSTGLIITHLSCSPSGLLCSWLDVLDEYWGPNDSFCGDHYIGEGTATVKVAEFATGRSGKVAELASPAFKWRPVMLKGQEPQRRPAQAHWAPDGLSLFLLKKTEECNCSCVLRLVF